MKPFSFSLISLSILLLCTGCSRRGASELLPILSVGISSTNNHQLLLTAEAVRQDSLEGNAAPVYLRTAEDSPDALFRSAERLLAGTLYLSHARTFVIDQSVGENDLPALVASLLSRKDVRLTLRIAVARGVSADEIIRAEAVAQEIPGEALATMLDAYTHHGNLPNLPLCLTADRLLSGSDFCLPALTLTTEGRVIPAGFAQFRAGRFVGFSRGERDA